MLHEMFVKMGVMFSTTALTLILMLYRKQHKRLFKEYSLKRYYLK